MEEGPQLLNFKWETFGANFSVVPTVFTEQETELCVGMFPSIGIRSVAVSY